MKLSVRTVTDKRISLEVHPNDSVDHLKALIQHWEKTPIHQQWLIYAGKELKAGRICDYNICDGSVVCMVKPQRLDELNIFTDPPSHPQFATFSSRLESFQNWPSGKSQRPNELAEAGFFRFSDYVDGVKCFHCDIQLHSWLDGELPWVEHAKWSQHCQFLLLSKGKQLVVQTNKTENSAPKTFADLSKKSINLKTIQISHALSVGFKEEQIVKAIADNGYKLFPSVSDLIEGIGKLRMSQKPSIPSYSLPKFRNLAEENQYLKEQRLCKICLDNEACVVFLPCGHLISCPLCAAALKFCPICRGPIRGSVRSFTA